MIPAESRAEQHDLWISRRQVLRVSLFRRSMETSLDVGSQRARSKIAEAKGGQ